jgi:lipopolysaccharide export system protein LptA
LNKFIFLFVFGILLTINIFGQNASRVKLVRADELVYDKNIGADVQRVRGNAVFQHKSATLYCDSAYFFGNSNKVIAYGHVHINDNEIVHIYSDSLNYSGDLRIANLYGNIKMIDPQMTLTTNQLTYDLNEKKGFYSVWGKIVNKENILTSKTGIYFTQTKDLFFKREVVLTNPEYNIYCDTLIYNTVSGLARFHGPTNIVSDQNTIYCEKGWYDTKANTSEFSINAYLKNQNQKIIGDRMLYDRNIDYGRAFKNVILTDSVNKLTVYSQYVEYRGLDRYAMSVDSTLAIIEDKENDSTFLHSDTIIVHFDTLKEARLMLAFHKTQLYKSNLQTLCDSMAYNFKDSLIQLFTMPILWSGKSQLTGEYMEIHTSGESPERMDIKTTAFILSNDTFDFYNQISGKDMVGYFVNGEFTRLDVFGNAETIYFARDEKKELVGVDIAIAGDLRITILYEEIKDIIYFDEPNGTIHPLKDLSPNEMKLREFINYESARPKNKDDVFIWKMK